MIFFNNSFIEFFETLSKNNNTVWFNQNRNFYEISVKKPFYAFVENFITQVQNYDPEIKIKPADAIMRINKDIRFSSDKTPYKTHMAANISLYGKKDKAYPGFYFQFSHESIIIYGGSYMIESTMLNKIRTYIANNLQEFSMAYNEESFKEKYGNILGEKNKKLPEELQKLVSNEPLIANKQFYYSAELDNSILIKEELTHKMLEYYLAGKKLNNFLKKPFSTED